jgi:penicillin-binding protein 2
VASDALEPLPLQARARELIRRALHGVTQEGTSTRVFAGAPYPAAARPAPRRPWASAGEKYNAAKLEEHKRDHSLYIAAAPLDAPTVALAVVVENAGFGAQAAAPIARRVFDYLLLGQYPSEEDMALTREGKSAAPVASRAAPRRAAAGQRAWRPVAAAAHAPHRCIGGAAAARRAPAHAAAVGRAREACR